MSMMFTRRRASAMIGAGLCGAAMSGTALADASLAALRKRGSIRVAIANEVPYGYMGPDGNAHGIGPDVAKHVLRQLGIDKIEWVVVPFGSLIPGLSARRFDMVAAEQNILPARCQVVAFSVPNSSYGEGLLVKAGNPDKIHSYADIKNNPKLKLAVVSGADELRFAHGMNIPDSQIVEIQSNADALSAVQTGRVSAYAATGLTVGRLAKHSKAVEPATPFTQPIVDGKSVRSYGAFSFRKDEKTLLTAFDKALTTFKGTTGWADILTHAGLTRSDLAAARRMTTAQRCAGS